MTNIHELSDQARAVAYMYDTWAHGYEQDVLQRYRYDAPKKVVEAIERLAPSSVKSILDLATGTGIVLEELKKSFHTAGAIGLDISDRMLHECSKKPLRANLHHCDIETEVWPVESNSVDIVSCAGALGLIQNVGHVLAETRRTLKTGGLSVMSFQIASASKGGNLGGYGDMVRSFQRYVPEMTRLVENAGLRVIEPVEDFIGFQTNHTRERHGVIAFTKD